MILHIFFSSWTTFLFCFHHASFAPVPTEALDPEYRMDLFEGDIAGIDMDLMVSNANEGETQSNGILGDKFRWDQAIIPFEIYPSFSREHLDMIRDAMEGYHKETCIRFKPKTRADKDYISIRTGLGCNSNVGKTGGRQDIIFETPGCMIRGKIQHELMHAIGFFHEQSRTDRDEYVEINRINLDQDKIIRNFAKYTSVEVSAFGEPYDYGSVMHYDRNAFSIGKDDWTIRPLPPNENSEIGQRKGLSQIDINKINKMYDCSEKLKQTVTTPTTTPTTTATTKAVIHSQTETDVSQSKLNPSLPKVLKTLSSNCNTYYTVREDDTCSDLQDALGISTTDFMNWNLGVDCSHLDVGQRLCVGATAVQPIKKTQLDSSCQKWTLVKSADGCWDVWSSNQLKKAEFEAMNQGIECSHLPIGQKLCVKKGPGTPNVAMPECSAVYGVRDGDICLYISNGFGLTIDQFKALNQGLNCGALQVGQDVCVAN